MIFVLYCGSMCLFGWLANYTKLVPKFWFWFLISVRILVCQILVLLYIFQSFVESLLFLYYLVELFCLRAIYTKMARCIVLAG